MAFRSMVTGAECSTGSNPLSQIMKQVNDDRSLLKFRTGIRPDIDIQDDKFAQQFFDQRNYSHLPDVMPLVHDIPDPRLQDWSSEFRNFHHDPYSSTLEAAEAAEMELAFKRMAIQGNWNTEFLYNPDVSTTPFAEIPPEFEVAFEKNFNLIDDKGKGKEKVVDADSLSWEEQFMIAQREAENAQETDDGLRESFEKIWSQFRLRDYTDESNIESLEEILNNTFSEGQSSYLGEYEFESNNIYLEYPNPLQEGLEIMERGGSLSEAALAFESAVQKDDNDSNAWMLLGSTQAQNEKEESAIKALQKSVELDGTNLSALMNLAVSYINERFDLEAYLTLERWLTVKYPDVVAQAAPMDRTIDTHTRVTDLFLKAARCAPEGQEMDPDVQVGLGVLFYGSGESDKAIDCFVSALKIRKDDYQLWNRLGATLANSGRSEDAIEAYYKALELKPTFVRARFNLGVSCLNIKCYQEAAEHLLGALSMHQMGPGNDGIKNASNSLRETLEKTFQSMNRSDLCEKLNNGLGIDQFRDEFEF
ncbi:9682_t:CDS:2 [Acaulospora colombiana]|uniref:9682_t:CDS:1 n=1 Tax=Acaulospora colombiana TaxID=27376 RepID=A0ACA9KIW0_9GLOM|nr:9682_t:CDS:2 [Acaulospora colombiana]